MTQRERDALQRLVDTVAKQVRRPTDQPGDDDEQASEPMRGHGDGTNRTVSRSDDS